MKLISLVASNFKKHVSLTLDFTDGLNVIIGPNWAGKSSALEALICALYGQAVLPAKKEDIPTWGKTNYNVQLAFKHNQETYLVERSLRNAEVKDATDSRLLASGHTACTKFIEDLLGLSFKTFALFVLSQQGETTGALTFGATALQRQVEDFSGADIIDKVVAAARQGMNRLQGRVEEPEVPFTHQLEQVVCEREGLSTELYDFQESLRDTKTKLTTLQGKKADNQTAVSELEQQVAQLQEDVQKERRLLQRIETLSTEFKAAKRRYMEIAVPAVSMETMENKQARIQARLDDLHQSIQVWKAHQTAVNNWAQTTEALTAEGQRWGAKIPELKSMIEEKAQVQADWDKLQEELTAKTAQLNDATAEQKHLASEVKTVKRAISAGVCSECERPFEGVDSHGMEEKLEGLVIQQRNCTSRINSLEDEVQELTSKAGPLAKIVHSDPEAELEKVAQEIGRINEQLETLERPQLPPEATVRTEAACTAAVEQCDQLRTELGAIAYEMKAFKKAKLQQDEAAEEARNMEQLLAAKKQELEDLDVDGAEDRLAGKQAELKALVEKGDSLKDQVHDLQLQEKTLQSDVRDFSQQIDRLAKEEETLKIKIEAQKELSGEIDRHKRLIKHLTDSRSQYMQKVWDHILGLASKTLSTATQGVLTRVLRDESGNFLADERGKLTPLANLSGAQKAFVGVSVRVGLSAALYGKTGLLILDEPSADMNAENSMQLAGALMGLGGQCLLITHRPFEQLAAQNLIEIGG